MLNKAAPARTWRSGTSAARQWPLACSRSPSSASGAVPHPETLRPQLNPHPSPETAPGSRAAAQTAGFPRSSSCRGAYAPPGRPRCSSGPAPQPRPAGRRRRSGQRCGWLRPGQAFRNRTADVEYQSAQRDNFGAEPAEAFDEDDGVNAVAGHRRIIRQPGRNRQVHLPGWSGWFYAAINSRIRPTANEAITPAFWCRRGCPVQGGRVWF